MDNPRHCAQCGAALSEYALEGLCGNCLLKPGVEPAPTILDELAEETCFPALGAGSGRSGDTKKIGRFGDYELLEEIARGGMGIVYRARQVSLDRIVAVKMLLAGPLAGKDFVQRFRTEAAAAASLQHPNIVAIHEVGFVEGQHFFAMDYVEGLTLAQLVAKGPLPARQAATYLKTIAGAIHFAHERNVLHRDLKPSNVLVDSATDQPRVTDFGLAKRLETETELTLSGQMLGSPNYMSPEQAAAKRGTVGKRSDVYSLGAILYHLLTGRPPFQGETLTDILRQLADDDPLAPHLLTPRVPHDLETICVKCLEKEPAKRYRSAQELADELNRFVCHEPIHARPIKRAERTWRWCRRKPAIASLSAATILLLLAVAIGSPIAAFRINRERQRAERERLRAEENLYAADMHEAETALEKGDLGRARKLIEAHRPGPKEADLRGFEWRLLWRRSRGDEVETLRGHTDSVRSVFFSPSGDLLASRSVDNTLKVWDLGMRQERFTIKDVTALGGFSADGKILAFSTLNGSVNLCEARTGVTLSSFENAGYLVALLDDGKTVVTTGETFLAKVWDAGTGKEKLVLPGPGGLSPLGPEFGLAVSVSPDGKLLAVIDQKYAGIDPEYAGTIYAGTIWDLPAQKVLTHLPGPLTFLQFSRDGKTVAAGSFRGFVNLWDVSGKLLLQIPAHPDTVFAAGFSPDGNILATTSDDQTVKLWDITTGAELDTLRGHESGVWAVAFSADGKRLASGGLDQTVKLWGLERHRPNDALTDVEQPFAWSPDSTMVASAHTDWTAKIWDAATLKTRHILPGVSHVLAFSQDGKTVSTTRTNGTVASWEVATGKVQWEVPTLAPLEKYYSMVVSPDRQMIAGGYTGGGVGLWEISSGKHELLTGHKRFVGAVTFSPDSGTLISGGHEGVIKMWDVTRRQCTDSFPAHTMRVVSLAISPDGQTLASGSTDHTIKLWDLKSKRFLVTLSGHKRLVCALAFAPDGKTLASSGADHTVRLWNVPRQREMTTLNLYQISAGVPEGIIFMEFSPDGNNLATITQRGILKLFRAATLDEMALRPDSVQALPNAAQ